MPHLQVGDPSQPPLLALREVLLSMRSSSSRNRRVDDAPWESAWQDNAEQPQIQTIDYDANGDQLPEAGIAAALPHLAPAERGWRWPWDQDASPRPVVQSV